MIEVAVMLEGQDGLNWPRWQNIASTVEEAGFAGLYRSDHFVNAQGPVKDSLELWVSLTWLASHTRRIEFGSLVSPVSFRDPVFTARIAMQVDALSALSGSSGKGRLRLGLGAGWNEREHHMFGYELQELPQRFERFQEGLEVITRLIQSPKQPANYSGKFYQLQDAVLLPAPPQPGPAIVIGGNGPKYTLPLVVQYADEWNAVDIPADKVRQLNDHLDDLLHKAGREPQSVKRSLMTTVIFGKNEAQLKEKLNGRSAEDVRKRGAVVGSGQQILDQLKQAEQAGVQRIMLRWNDLDDTTGLQALAQALHLKDGVVAG